MANKSFSAHQKIMIIEYYLIHKTNGLKSIAMDLDISLKTLLKYVKQYETDGFLIFSKGGRLSPIQELRIEELKAAGAIVKVWTDFDTDFI